MDPSVRVLTVGGQHPLRDPKSYSLQVPAAEPAPAVTTLAIVGDVMLGRRVGRAIADDPRAAFRPLAGRLSRADITVGNLESTLSTAGQPTQGGDSFGASPRVLRGPRGRPASTPCPWPTTTSATTATGRCARPWTG